jgi:hypothetical protein
MSDPYFSRVQEYWDTILRAYTDFEQKKPVILVDVDEAKIYAYPYHDFKADLAPQSQASLEQQYNAAVRDGKIVVFVRDNRKRKLVSYTISPEEG